MLTLPDISDDTMRDGLAQTCSYTVAILKAGPTYGTPGADKIVWEHGRRNFSLRAAGLLPIVCPVVDQSEVRGIGIFAAAPHEVEQIMLDDPGVKAGVFTFEVHP